MKKFEERFIELGLIERNMGWKVKGRYWCINSEKTIKPCKSISGGIVKCFELENINRIDFSDTVYKKKLLLHQGLDKIMPEIIKYIKEIKSDIKKKYIANDFS